jgi:hypothetical protein
MMKALSRSSIPVLLVWCVIGGMGRAVAQVADRAAAGAALRATVVDPSRRLDTPQRMTAPDSLADSADLTVAGLEDENVFAPGSPGDQDLGDQLILKETPRQRPFRVYADTYVFWTDNAGNTPVGELSDTFLGGRLGAGWQPRLGQRWFADFDVSQQFFRYDQFGVLDFELLEASANLIHVLPQVGNILLFAGPHYRRMTNNDLQDELMNSFSIRAGVQKVFLIDRRNSITASVMGDWDVATDLDQVFRHEYSGEVGWRLKIMRDLVLNTSYRFIWYDYTRLPREDALSLVSASLSWTPRRWLEIYASGNFSDNASNVDLFDYQTASVGGGLGVKIRF